MRKKVVQALGDKRSRVSISRPGGEGSTDRSWYGRGSNVLALSITRDGIERPSSWGLWIINIA
jgi:hypothetical protein